MTRTFLAVVFAALTLAGCSKTPSKSEFANTALVAGTFEIESSKIAQTKSKRDDVKAFAAKMITDHTAAAENLKKAAPEDGVQLGAPALDDDHADKLRQLQEAKPEDFDALYIKMQRKAHDDAVSLFSDYSKNGAAGALKTFAGATLPTLEQHQAHVKSLPL